MYTVSEIAGLYRAEMLRNIETSRKGIPINEAAYAYRQAAMYYTGAADQIRKTIDVWHVSGQPYATADEQWADIRDGVLYVSSDFCEHEYWTAEQNINYRIVHDYNDHRPLFGEVPQFTTKGELSAWNQRARLALLPPEVAAVRFSETIGQLCYVDTFGEFPDQRHAGVLLPDYIDVTAFVSPYP